MKALKQCVEVCFFLNLIGGHKRYFYLESGGRAFNVCNYTKCRAALSSKKFNFIFAEMGIVARSMMKGKIYRTNKKGAVVTVSPVAAPFTLEGVIAIWFDLAMREYNELKVLLSSYFYVRY